jgi:hypothetical protein
MSMTVQLNQEYGQELQLSLKGFGQILQQVTLKLNKGFIDIANV